MKLDSRQADMLEGRFGLPSQIAMRMLTAVGSAYDAEELIPVGSVHLGISGMSMAEPGMRFLEKLVAHEAAFVVPTTLNILSMDRDAVGTVPAIRADEEVQLRIARASETLGAKPTYTCNPFLLGVAPRRNESVAWNESATAPYINSVLGARTNREGATALASALTGYTPNYGMHVPANRVGAALIEVTVPVSGADDFNVLGGAVARAAGARIPVVEGIQRPPSLDEWTAFCAAFAAISNLAMFHVVGITPEAPTRADAMGAAAPARPPMRIGAAELTHERARYETAREEALDVVAIGCPHASLDQVTAIADMIGSRSVDPKVSFVVQVNRDCAESANQTGLAQRLAAAGVTLLSDSCVHVAYDQIPQGRTLATNSLKIAYLTASHNVNVHFGTLDDCVRAAVAGRWLSSPAKVPELARR